VTTVAIGALSIVNALFGGHPACLQSAGSAIVGGPDAGPRDRRYIAALIAGAGALFLAAMASTASALLTVLPANLVATLAGLAILCTLLGAVERTATSDLRLGAFFALLIASSPLMILGIGAALWSIVGGFIISLALERPALMAAIRDDQSRLKESPQTIACAGGA
jgi:benzoate membrane transport protein